MVVNHSPVIEFHQGWELMVTGITKLKRILEDYPEPPFTSQDYMTLYTTIYNMCTQKPPHDYSQQLYDNYKEVFDEYTTNVVLPWLQEKHDEFMLSELVKSWANHKVMVRWLSRFFHYLDRYFITRRSLPNLNQVGVSSFREHIYENMKVSAKDAVLALIEKEREGEQIDRSLLKHVLEFSIEVDLEGNLQCYVSDFETHMLDATSGYYSRKSVVWIAEDSCPEYMMKVEDVLRKERERVSHYLHSSTEEKLVEKVQYELLTVYSSQLLEKENSGCRVLLRNDKVDDLSRMYRLFSKIAGGLEPVANMFHDHVKEEGMALVQQAEDAATNSKVSGDKKDGAQAELVFIRKVIELHDKYLAYVNNCFGSHALFHKSFKEAFEVFCNKTIAGSSSSELLANFAEDVLKKGGSTEKLSDEAIDQTLDKIVRILVFVSDKDLFAEFYRKKLARRLMQEKSGNDDHERSILSKLKQQFGAQYTSKMEGMVTDLALAKENQSSFPEYLNQKSVHLGLDFVVTTLTTGYWPSYKSADLNLPMEIVKAVQVFKEFYDTKTRSRRLTWLHSMSNCQLNGKFAPKTIELQVSAYQAVVLMLFNDADRLSYKEIQVQSNLPDDDLVRILHSLSCAKYKILLKEANSKNISATDTFEFHLKFTDKMRRIRVPLPPLDEKKKVIEDVDKDRRYSIDASLVRIMKSRKVLGYQQLVLECVEQLSRMFKPDIRVIKKRIEDLITRDYLERDAENPNTFKYLA